VNRIKNARLSTRVFSVLVATTAIVFAVIILFTLGIVRDLAIKTQEEKAALLIHTVEPSVSVSLYLGIRNIDEKLAAISHMEQVIYIKVTDIQGNIAYSHQYRPSVGEPIRVTRALKNPSSFQNIGYITLTYSGQEFADVMEQFYILYGWIATGVVIILMVIAAWINRLLLPFQQIARKVEDFKPGDKIIFDIPDSHNEMTQIISAFERMQDRVSEYSRELEAVRKNLEIKVAEQTHELMHHLYYDNLTGLPNRLKLQEELSADESNTIAIVNIDDFKEINDFFGIDAADKILIQIARWFIEMKYRPYRIGGDEFAFRITKNTSPVQFRHDIEMLLALLSQKSFMIAEENVHVRATAGIAIGSDKPLIHADVALHKARAQRLPSSVYDPGEGIEQQYQTNIAMSSHIRQALVEHRIVCQYQPIVSCTTGKIEKYETLVRIQNEDGTLITPSEFLPIAKKTKLYHHITQEVIYQACHVFMGRDEEFSINLSNSDITDKRTVVTIENILRQTGTANRIIFEILESEGIENFEEVASFIAKMKSLGAKIAIDDFGTGYSNYEHILRLNVDIIKIDGSLIKSIAQNPRHKIVVEAIVDFARRIGVDTVAEYVIDAETLQHVTDLGIAHAQGSYTGLPQFMKPLT